MKRIFLLFYSLLLISGKFSAQEDSTKKSKKWGHELGLNIYALCIKGGDHYTNYQRTANNYAFSGLNLKFYNKKNVIRTSVDYLQQIIVSNGMFPVRNNLVSSRGLQLSAGYQRMLGKKNTSLFVFTDLSCKYIKELRSNNLYYGYWDYFYRNNLIWINSFVTALSPGVGLRIKIKKNVMLTLESAAQFYYSKENGYNVQGINIIPVNACIGFKF